MIIADTDGNLWFDDKEEPSEQLKASCLRSPMFHKCQGYPVLYTREKDGRLRIISIAQKPFVGFQFTPAELQAFRERSEVYTDDVHAYESRIGEATVLGDGFVAVLPIELLCHD